MNTKWILQILLIAQLYPLCHAHPDHDDRMPAKNTVGCQGATLCQAGTHAFKSDHEKARYVYQDVNGKFYIYGDGVHDLSEKELGAMLKQSTEGHPRLGFSKENELLI